ncbi:outer membrane protein assembly factor BamB family protein [Streptomyces liangshanensis]|uniref:outer membrane protein assembly factor BamB family protein n=1 Tax=Streptomyces liangshanensis TaxID=2717324 RepID=UPI0036DBF2A1
MTQPPGQQPQPPQEPRREPEKPPQAPSQPPQPPTAPPTPAAPPTSQPGYGQPAQPGPYGQPGQPGYGYPQAPGQAPGPQPGPYAPQPGPYGQQPGPYAPQQGPYAQQPGPYGQQAGPYAQQPGPYGRPGPYGYPPQQFPGAPTPPPGGGRNPFKGKPGLAVAAAVAALLVVGGGTYAVVSGGDSAKEPVADKSQDPKPTGGSSAGPDGGVDQGDGTGGGRESDDDLNAGRKDGESKVLFLQTNDVDLPRNGSDVYGPWFAGDTVVKAMYKQVVGYSATDGKKKWTLDLPAELCAAPSAPSADGKIVVAYMNGTSDKSDCNQLQVVDLATGKGGWKQEIKEIGLFDILSDVNLTISGGTVTAARTAGAQAYRMTDGKQVFEKSSGSCKPFAFAGGPKLIAAESCSTGDFDTSQHQLEELDPATGKAKWTYKLAKNWEVDKVYSVDPLVISTREKDKDASWNVLALNANGTLRSSLAGGKDSFAPNCGGGFVIFGRNLEGCTGVAADAKHFYMATAPAKGSTSRTNEVIAFDLNTGKPTWRSKAPADRTITPLRMDGGNVVAYVEPTYEHAGAVATIAPTGGAPKIVQQHPASTAEIEDSFYQPTLAWASGRLYVVGGRISASNDAAELKEKTMMAFGN